MNKKLGLLVVVVSVSVAGAFACSAPPATSESDLNGDSELAIQFPEMYSAFESTHDYKIPAMVTGVKKVKWSIDDPDAADLEPGADGTSVMITVRKAGDFTLTAKAGSLKGTAPIHITEASADDWSDGDKRYNDGVVIQRGGHGDGGAPDGGHGGYAAPDKQAACTNCHGDGSKMDVQHTPMQTAGYSDQDLINIFTKAQKPQGVPQRIMPLDRWQKIHQWDVPENVQKGIIIYLRSLEPKSQGVTDWGGHGKGGKGGDKGGSGQGGGSGSGSGSSNSGSQQ